MKWIDAGRCYKPKGTKLFLNSLEFCFSNHINKINDYPWFVHSKAHGLQRPLLVNRIISLFPLLPALFNPFVKLLSWDTTTANTVYATIHLVSVLFRICVLNYVCRWLELMVSEMSARAHGKYNPFEISRNSDAWRKCSRNTI